MKIYFDMDDVGNELNYCLFEAYNKEHNDNIDCYQRENVYVEESDNVKVGHEYFKSVLHREGFFLNLEPVPGYVEIIKKLIDENYEVRILTHPQWDSKYCMNEKVEWIKKHLPFFNLDNIIYTRLKGEVGGQNRILVDDNPYNLTHWEENGGIGIAFGKNKYSKKWSGYIANDFEELYDLIKCIEKENNILI